MVGFCISLNPHSCFPHIVNLSCKAVIAAITDTDNAGDSDEEALDYEPSTFEKDCIATVRGLVKSVSL